MVERVPEIEATRNSELEYDEKGFFVIFLNEGKIVVEHYANVRKGEGEKIVSGRLAKVVTGTDAEAIGQTLLREGLVSRLDHALYLGRELQKAEAALRSGGEYEQDA